MVGLSEEVQTGEKKETREGGWSGEMGMGEEEG
jgi:hypothetical protein